MSEFDKKLRLKEKAEEDMYFARRDQELIRALHEEHQAESTADKPEEEQGQPGEPHKGAEAVADRRKGHPKKLLGYLRKWLGRQ